MFEYLPGNYVWNLGVVATLNSGGLIDEVDRACGPIRDVAQQGSDVGTAENDRQIPVAYAHASYEQAVRSPKRELRVFTADVGATEHLGLDHLTHVSTFIADWVADTFAELP